MSLILAAILIVGGLVGAIAVAVSVPALFGMIAYDVMDSRRHTKDEVEDRRLRIALERGFARGFVIGGGVFWSIASFAGLFSFRESGVGYALLAAFYPLVACLATLAIGWYYERVAAVLLAAASIAVVAWGVIYQFELGVWVIMGFFVLGPMLTASVLFWLARRDQEALELALSLQLQPELAPAVARSEAR
jgi:hypothetical protein